MAQRSSKERSNSHQDVPNVKRSKKQGNNSFYPTRKQKYVDNPSVALEKSHKQHVGKVVGTLDSENYVADLEETL